MPGKRPTSGRLKVESGQIAKKPKAVVSLGLKANKAAQGPVKKATLKTLSTMPAVAESLAAQVLLHSFPVHRTIHIYMHPADKQQCKLQVHGIASLLQEQAITELAGLTALEQDLKSIAKVQQSFATIAQPHRHFHTAMC